MEIFLQDGIAAASEGSVLCADDGGVDDRIATRIFRSIDEASEVAVVEVTKPLYFNHDGDDSSDASHDLRRDFKAQVHPLGSDVKH